jgi:hypothetical protein
MAQLLGSGKKRPRPVDSEGADLSHQYRRIAPSQVPNQNIDNWLCPVFDDVIPSISDNMPDHPTSEPEWDTLVDLERDNVGPGLPAISSSEAMTANTSRDVADQWTEIVQSMLYDCQEDQFGGIFQEGRRDVVTQEPVANAQTSPVRSLGSDPEHAASANQSTVSHPASVQSSAEAVAGSLDSPDIPPDVEGHSQEEWERHRPFIWLLYADIGLSLPDVMKIMKAQGYLVRYSHP